MPSTNHIRDRITNSSAMSGPKSLYLVHVILTAIFSCSFLLDNVFRGMHECSDWWDWSTKTWCFWMIPTVGLGSTKAAGWWKGASATPKCSPGDDRCSFC